MKPVCHFIHTVASDPSCQHGKLQIQEFLCFLRPRPTALHGNVATTHKFIKKVLLKQMCTRTSWRVKQTNLLGCFFWLRTTLQNDCNREPKLKMCLFSLFSYLIIIIINIRIRVSDKMMKITSACINHSYNIQYLKPLMRNMTVLYEHSALTYYYNQSSV